MKKYIISIILLGYFGLFFLLLTGLETYWYLYEKPQSQPIAFSHQIHVLKMTLPCDLCHMYATKSISAGIPSVSKCMDCHRAIATDKPEIKKVLKYWQNREPIPWVRIHSLPGFVYFSHKRHLKRGIDCSECHGDVKAMATIRKVRSLKMGWCITCHKSRSAPTDCLTCHK